MDKINFSYDSEAKAGYIYISHRRVEKTYSFHGINVDVDENDEIVGIEFFGE